MKNLLNFFFSFDKLFKEKLIVPFFWLAIIVWGLGFFESFLAGINLGPLAFAVMIIGNIITILLALVSFRLIAEIAIALFRINDNLSPDGGKSELVDIDPVEEARKAAELAAAKTREATKTVRTNVGEISGSVQDKAKAATASVREKADGLKSKTGIEKVAETRRSTPEIVANDAPKKRDRPVGSKNTVKAAPSKPATVKPAAKKRGRPVGSKNKTTTKKQSSVKTATSKTPGKRGPKPGTKIPRDADGNLLKKDGTPRKKPGPRKS